MCARAFGSLSLGQLGYPEKALASCREGLALAEMLAHPFSIGIALWAAGILHQLRREPDAMRQVGERMIHYGGEKGLRMIVPFSKVSRDDRVPVKEVVAHAIELRARAQRRVRGAQEPRWH